VESLLLKEGENMRRISSLLAPLSLALFLLAPEAMTGCSASGRVRVNNPDSHFTNNSDRQPYAPHNGGNYRGSGYNK
jgi:hypothetical protein